MDAPLVHDHGLELAGDAGLEDALLQGSGHAVSVVDEDEGLAVAFARAGEVDVAGVGVARVAQHLDDDILNGADIVLGLAPLCLGGLEAHKAVSQILLDSQVAVAAHRVNEVCKTLRHGANRLSLNH